MTLTPFLEAIGRSLNDRIYVRHFSPKEASLEDRLAQRQAYIRRDPQQGDVIQPLSPMGYLTHDQGDRFSYTGTNNRDKGKTFTDGLAHMHAINARGYGSYFTVNPGGPTDSQIIKAPCLFFEIDSVNKAEQQQRIDAFTEQLGVTPTVNETRNSFHVYVRLTEPLIDLDLWQQTQQRLIQLVDSDPSIHNLSRVLRLPDFDYWYVEDGIFKIWDTVKNLSLQSEPISLRQILSILPELDKSRWGYEEPTNNSTSTVTSSQPRSTTFNDASEYFDIRNFMHHLENFRENGRQGWHTATCPHQGSGHSGRKSKDSLHIQAATGKVKCHSGCSGQDIFRSAIQLAQQKGYPTFQEFLLQRGYRKPRQQYHPDINAPAPPIEEETFFGSGADTSNMVTVPSSIQDNDLTYLAGLFSEPDLIVTDEPGELPPGYVRSDQLGETENQPTDKIGAIATIAEVDETEPIRSNDLTGQTFTSIKQAIALLELSEIALEVMSRYYWLEDHEAWYDRIQRKPLKRFEQTVDVANPGDLFQNHSGNFLKIKDALKPVQPHTLLAAQSTHQACCRLVYRPGAEQLVPVKDNKLPALNLAEPLPAPPDYSAEDVKIWRDHLRHLFTDDQADFMEWWMAMTLFRPEVVFDYAPVLIAQNQRTGRETALRPLMWALGKQAYALQCPQFSGKDTRFLQGIKLLKLNELPAAKKKYSALDIDWATLIKTWVDAQAGKVLITANYQRDVEIERAFNVVALSNHVNCLEIGEGERRLLPIISEWSPYLHTENGHAYMAAITEFLNEEGCLKVYGYLSTVNLDDERWSPYYLPEQISDINSVTEWVDDQTAEIKLAITKALNQYNVTIKEAIALPLPWVNELLRSAQIELTSPERNKQMKKLGFSHNRSQKRSERWPPKYRYYVNDKLNFESNEVSAFLNLWED